MISAATVERDRYGEWTHPMYEDWLSSHSVVTKPMLEAWAESMGIEVNVFLLDSDGDAFAAQRDYELSASLARWDLKPPAGQGWFLLSVHDSEEGGVQVWARHAFRNGGR